jgi:hypothetical protein
VHARLVILASWVHLASAFHRAGTCTRKETLARSPCVWDTSVGMRMPVREVGAQQLLVPEGRASLVGRFEFPGRSYRARAGFVSPKVLSACRCSSALDLARIFKSLFGSPCRSRSSCSSSSHRYRWSWSFPEATGCSRRRAAYAS